MTGPARLLPAVLAVCALALAACGSSDKLEGNAMKNIETGIKQKIEQSNPATHVVYVHCPKSVKRKKGVVFTCHVKGSKPGQQADATVTETSNKGAVHFVVP
jgi:poly(3-hydroxybutyrate) depolymerase